MLLVPSTSTACGDSSPAVTVEDEEIKVLTDAMLLEAMLQDFTGQRKDSLAFVNYELLYKRHGINEEDLEEMRNRFSQTPELWSIAADSVESRLKLGRSNFDTLLNLGLN